MRKHFIPLKESRSTVFNPVKSDKKVSDYSSLLVVSHSSPHCPPHYYFLKLGNHAKKRSLLGPVSRKSVNFSGPKSHFKNWDPLILKSWSFTRNSRYERANFLQNFMPGNVFVFKMRRKLWHPKCARKVSGVSRNARGQSYPAQSAEDHWGRFITRYPLLSGIWDQIFATFWGFWAKNWDHWRKKLILVE